jgi:hypothetical protein
MAVKIYSGDPWKELDRRVWVCLSTNTLSFIRRVDLKLYKGVTSRIYKPNRKGGLYSFWVKRKSFRQKGHRFL